jgi:tetratricopeptide (TPR) repeat protein
MTRRRQTTVIALLGIVGLLGVAVVAVAQLNLQAALRQYEQRLAQIDKNNPNALYDLAKWSYQNGLKDEALKLAIEANAKAPDDVRPKFLAWAITAANLTGEETGGEGIAAVVTISPEEVKAVLEREGADVIRRFSTVQGMLFGRCGSRACHGGGNPDAPFVLITGASNEKTLVQNFLAINKYLDREKPDESRLLLKPLTGESKHPKKFSAKTDPVFHSISTWIDTLKTEGERLWKEKAAEKPPLPALEPK